MVSQKGHVAMASTDISNAQLIRAVNERLEATALGAVGLMSCKHNPAKDAPLKVYKLFTSSLMGYRSEIPLYHTPITD